ncbi:MAG: hypothetical protein OXU36_07070 [Candidatus Poribacteria bacterium]|nr:hypothetical protein [Candidatus Poribacteria bacterium]
MARGPQIRINGIHALNQNQRYSCLMAFTGYEARMGFTGHEPGMNTNQNQRYSCLMGMNRV